jgi:hypothetical protein
MSDRQRDGVLRLLCIIVATIGIVFSAMSIYYYYTTNQFVNNTDSAEWLFKVIFSETASPIASASALFVAFAAFIQNSTSSAEGGRAGRTSPKWFTPVFLVLCILGIVVTEIARFELVDDPTIAQIKQNIDAAGILNEEKIRNSIERSYEAWRTNFIVYAAMMLGMRGT